MTAIVNNDEFGEKSQKNIFIIYKTNKMIYNDSMINDTKNIKK